MDSDAERSVIVNFHLSLLSDKWIEKENINFEESNDNDNDNKQDDEFYNNTVDSGSMLRKYIKPRLYQIRDWLLNDKCDSLVIATKQDALSLIIYLWDCLDYGCPFVVWDQSLNTLINVYNWLKNNKDNQTGHKTQIAINLRLHDSLYREHQVLPQRTHPMMNMMQLGGYLLSGTKCYPRPVHIVANDNNDDDDGLNGIGENDKQDDASVGLPPNKKSRAEPLAK